MNSAMFVRQLERHHNSIRIWFKELDLASKEAILEPPEVEAEKLTRDYGGEIPLWVFDLWMIRRRFQRHGLLIEKTMFETVTYRGRS